MNEVLPDTLEARVASVHLSSTHTLQKYTREKIQLIAGIGVSGDAHSGVSVKHRSRVRRDPSQPNLRQVHLIHQELFTELEALGFSIQAGQMGENITTQGVDLLDLPKDTTLHIGENAIVQITGLRNPCAQLDTIQPGLMKALITRDDNDKLVRKAGVMSTVLCSGTVHPNDTIKIRLPEEPHIKLDTV